GLIKKVLEAYQEAGLNLVFAREVITARPTMISKSGIAGAIYMGYGALRLADAVIGYEVAPPSQFFKQVELYGTCRKLTLDVREEINVLGNSLVNTPPATAPEVFENIKKALAHLEEAKSCLTRMFFGEPK
ncbi:MAG: hypothetical protein ABL958_20755, partial [Bdellovibrionia bacterium]